jgi:serine/threonine-protein kinase
MGSVDLVVRREGRFERWYAMKRLHQQYRDDPDFRAMFMDEARLAGLVRHPNVVSVLDVGEDGDGPFLIMDFVEGVSVAELIARAAERGTRLPVQLCVRIALGAARGLHAAHEARGPDGRPLALVHRDVSPHNILLSYDGVVRVSDFGIAKAFGNATRTSTGVLKGNMSYLAPEQLRFEEPDRRSDLFSLGVILYELLSGERLYPNKDGFDGTRRILDEPPPDIGSTRDDVPAALVELLFELLAKDRSQRPADAAQVAERLAAIADELVEDEGAVELHDYLATELGERRAAEQARLARQRDEAVRRAARARLRRRAWLAGGAVLVVLGSAAMVMRARPRTPAARPGTIRNVWAGGWHSCALDGGALYCWGKDNEGQLGDGVTTDAAIRRAVPLAGVRALAAGFFHTCACAGDGRVFCWGRNAEGQLGSGGGALVPSPTAVPGIAGCRAVATGAARSCVLRADGSVWCWGEGAGPAPVPVAGLSHVEEITAYGRHGCARRAAGDVWCWGEGESGQLGDGTRERRETPVRVRDLHDAVEIAAGLHVTCARRRGGAVACWGRNAEGQLGDGTRRDSAVPVAVRGIDDAVQIAAGAAHACALRAGGQLLCWGGGQAGVLGRGDEQDAPLPASVLAGGSFLSVSCGELHTCARHGDGVLCWGLNETGQLGDGTRSNRARPVSVAGFAP